MSDTVPDQVPSEDDLIDAYSRVVTNIADLLTPRVAALYTSRREPTGRIESGAGSAVVFTDDGFLLTNAQSSAPTPPEPSPSRTGQPLRSRSSAAIRSPTSRWCGPMG